MELKPTTRTTFSVALLCIAIVTFSSAGCSTLCDKSWSPRDNSVFTDLVQQRYQQSHPVAKSAHLKALAGDIKLASADVLAGVQESLEETSQQVRGQSPDGLGQASQIPASNNGGGVQRTAYQYPEVAQSGGIVPSFLSPNIGSPNEVSPFNAQGGVGSLPIGENYADLDVFVGETRTGSVNIGGAYNSDNGIVGQLVIDERNFDIRALPRSFRELWDGTAFRGGGQAFRLELVPGEQVQRYLVSFSEPYLFGTNYSLSVSGYLFDRQFFDWDEQRLGGRISLGRRLTPDLSFNVGLRLEDVEISDPRTNDSPTLNESLGDSDLYLFNVGLIRDTRDHPFLATEGSYLSLMYTQGFGDFDYPRGDVEYRRYRLLYERPDGSGRHTVSFGTKLGITGSSTCLLYTSPSPRD